MVQCNLHVHAQCSLSFTLSFPFSVRIFSKRLIISSSLRSDDDCVDKRTAKWNLLQPNKRAYKSENIFSFESC